MHILLVQLFLARCMLKTSLRSWHLLSLLRHWWSHSLRWLNLGLRWDWLSSLINLLLSNVRSYRWRWSYLLSWLRLLILLLRGWLHLFLLLSTLHWIKYLRSLRLLLHRRLGYWLLLYILWNRCSMLHKLSRSVHLLGLRHWRSLHSWLTLVHLVHWNLITFIVPKVCH